MTHVISAAVNNIKTIFQVQSRNWNQEMNSPILMNSFFVLFVFCFFLNCSRLPASHISAAVVIQKPKGVLCLSFTHCPVNMRGRETKLKGATAHSH